METFSESDVRGLLEVLYEAGAVEGADPFAEPVRVALWRLVGCDVVNHFEATPYGRPKWSWEVGEPVAPMTSDIAEAMPVLWEQAPVQMLPTYGNRPVRSSDIVPLREQRRRDPWNYIQRPLGIRDSIWLCLATPDGIAGGFCCLDMGRGGVGDRELALLELLAPYLARFYGRAAARRDAAPPTHGLTPREYEIMLLVAEGKTNQETAAILWISPKTVRTHLEHAFEKLGVHTRAAAVARLLATPQ
jgi:DNA-binding CsgD family transcriptional regulator